MQAALIGSAGQTILGPAGLINGGIQRNQYVIYDCWVSARHTVISYLKQGYYTITNIRFLLCKSSLMTVPFLDENVAAAKSTFIGLSGQLVSDTIRLIEDSNSTWKIADLQKFERVPRRKL